jgi:hypothetical protein
MKQLFTLIAIALCISAHAQINWTGGDNISTSLYSNMHPRIALNRAGNPLVIWGKMGDESVLFSRWTGTTFTAPVKLNPSWLTIATASWMGPDIASHGDTVYVVVKRTPESNDTNRMYIFTSFDGGISFKPPVQFGFMGDSISRFPTVTTDATGNPIIAYMKFNSSFMDSRWVVIKSSDYGNTFSVETKASGWGNSAEVCDCCPGAIVSEGASCAMLYRDNNNDIRDDWAGISTNSATSFTNGIALEKNNWMINSCPASGPDGVIIDDTIYSTFMSGASGNYRTYLSKSSISGGAMGSIRNLTGAINGLSQQNYPRIASDGKAMAVVWKQTVNGVAQLPILFANDIAKGFPVSYDTVDLTNITNADVAMSKGNIFVVWQDDNSRTVKYRSGTYNQLALGIHEVEAVNFSIYPNPTIDELYITASNNINFSLNIFNSVGEKVYSSQGTSNMKLQTSNFAKGAYFIQINTGQNLITKKIVKI